MSDNLPTDSKMLWTWAELSAGLTGAVTAGPDVSGVCVDSRQVVPGDLFVALPGDPGPRFNPSYRSDVDGHSFGPAAMAAGAVGALVHLDAEHCGVPGGYPLLQVKDTYDGLWQLGRLARARLRGDVVAVTGSSGKTTAKNFLKAALAAYAPPGSYNNHIGVPLSLCNTPPDSPAAVYEIGTNHPGEIAPLAEMVAADVAVLLNVHVAHIENFSDQGALKEEKVNIFKYLESKDRAVSEDLLELGFGLTFGRTRNADARVLSLAGDMAEIDLCGRCLQARVPGGGVHRACTVAATLLTCQLLERDLTAACNLPADVVPKGRGNLRQCGNITLVDDSYNANPDSMVAALQSFAELSGPSQRIAVIGEMLELGDASAAAHLDLAPHLHDMDAVYCVGAGTKALAESIGAQWQLQADAALRADLRTRAAAGSAIFIKGSNRVFWASGFVDRLTEELE